MARTVGIVGFGRIGRALHEHVRDDPGFEIGYVLARTPREGLPEGDRIAGASELSRHPVDLCVEAATHEAVAELGPAALEASDLMVLSASAFADPEVEDRLAAAAEANGADVYLPHGAVLGVDGLADAREALEEVSLAATKAPANLDFGYAEGIEPGDVTERTVLYEGPVRGLCELFPRNFNSHAVVALASLGMDRTETRLVADPESDTADHVIRASGEGFDLEVVRESAIEGVTGDYTLASVRGSIRRVLGAGEGLRFV